jgi:Ion channel
MDHNDFINCCWEAIMVMTTGKFFNLLIRSYQFLVGYGDFYPRTTLGRIVMVCCCIYGVTVVSMIIVTISNTLQHDSKEKKAFLLLEKISAMDKLKIQASHIIGLVGKLSLKKTRKNPEERREALNEIMKRKKKFNELRCAYKTVGDLDIKDQQELEFAKVEISLDDLNEKMIDMITKHKENPECLEFYIDQQNNRLMKDMDDLKDRRFKSKTLKNNSVLKTLIQTSAKSKAK